MIFNKPKIIFVEVDDTEKFPPEISVLNALLDNDRYELIICSLKPSTYIKQFCRKHNIALYSANGVVARKQNYDGLKLLKKFWDYHRNREKIWHIIDSVYKNEDLIWINSFITLKTLGDKILNYKYVIHLFELMNEPRMFYKLPYPKMGLKKYLENAYKVIECEYNRSCIMQAWFDLKNRPIVIPNKLYIDEDELSRCVVPKDICDVLESIKNKKIIIYQGILGPERPIELFARAVNELGSEFAMVIMSDNKLPAYITKNINNLYQIGYLKAPMHLLVTKKAYIGVLCYQASPVGYAGNDCLNSIYCAPNKIYEYSRYGLPMIGNDIPGLKYTLEYNGCGICVKDMTVDNIIDSIQKIDCNYDEYKNCSYRFYNDINVKNIIDKEVLDWRR